MANVDLVDLIPILKAIRNIKREYKQAIQTEYDDFSLYPVLTENFLDTCYNNGYVVGFRQCLVDYLGTSDGIEIALPRLMRELTPASFEEPNEADYDALTSIMSFCLAVRQDLKTILDLDTDLFELYPPQVATRADAQYVAGYNDGYLNAIPFIEGMDVLTPSLSCTNNLISITTPQKDIPTLELFYKKGSLDGDWIPYTLGEYIQVLESESPVRVYAYARIGSKNSSISSNVFEYNSFLAPTISFAGNIINIISNYPSDSEIKTKYRLSSWEGYNDFIDYDGLSIPVTSEITVWAYNYLGDKQSETVSQVCTPSEIVVDRPATPTINFSSETNVLTISSTTEGASIYYQKSGSGDGWIPYYGPVILSESGTYTAIAIKNGVESIPSASVVCTVSTSGGGVTPVGTTVLAPTIICNSNKVSVITSQTGVSLKICNKGATDIENGLTPDTWYDYTGPISISHTSNYQAKAVLNSDNTKQAFSVITLCQYFDTAPGSGSNPGGGSGSSSDEYVAPPLMSCNDSVLSITAVTVGSTVYYRENGVSDWTLYTSPISILSDWTYEAIATKYGYESSVVSLFCTTQIPAAPTISCTADGRVTITTPANGATILYKKEDDETWHTYSGPFFITETDTYQAKAVRNGYESSITTYECEVFLYPVSMSFSNNTLTLSCETSGVQIYYKTNSSDSSWSVYSSPISVYATTTYQARAYKDGVYGYTEELLCTCPQGVSASVSGHTVTLTCPTDGVEIYYKKSDASSWNEYIYPFEVNVFGNYSFRALKDTNYSVTNSQEIGTYCQTPSINFESDYNRVTISVLTSGNETLQYRFGTTGNWLTYTNPFTISDSVTVQARSTINGWYSDTVSQYCEFTTTEYSEQYFTIEPTSSAIIAAVYNWDLYYSTDNGSTWSAFPYYSLQNSDASDTVTISTKTLFKQEINNYDPGNGSTPTWGDYGAARFFTMSGSIKVYGNILSLVYGDNFTSYTTMPNWKWLFYMMFENGYVNPSFTCNVVDAKNLILPTNTRNYCYSQMFQGTLITSSTLPLLPATTLSSECYASMFRSCKNLTSLPSGLLPATTLSSSCYASMFRSCKNLTSLPSGLLPATTLAYACYAGMFEDTSLTSLPSGLLPATTLSSSCYENMFRETKLTSLPSGLLPATTLVYSCYTSMFWGCTSLTTVPSDLLPATTLAGRCYETMFTGCSELTSAPDLPATTLVNECYYSMLQYCSKLSYVKCLATNPNLNSGELYTHDWLKNSGTRVSTKIFVKKSGVTWPSGNSGIPSGWTVKTVL